VIIYGYQEQESAGDEGRPELFDYLLRWEGRFCFLRNFLCFLLKLDFLDFSGLSLEGRFLLCFFELKDGRSLFCYLLELE
jgi:hypothetical protein